MSDQRDLFSDGDPSDVIVISRTATKLAPDPKAAEAAKAGTSSGTLKRTIEVPPEELEAQREAAKASKVQEEILLVLKELPETAAELAAEDKAAVAEATAKAKATAEATAKSKPKTKTQTKIKTKAQGKTSAAKQEVQAKTTAKVEVKTKTQAKTKTKPKTRKQSKAKSKKAKQPRVPAPVVTPNFPSEVPVQTVIEVEPVTPLEAEAAASIEARSGGGGVAPTTGPTPGAGPGAGAKAGGPGGPGGTGGGSDGGDGNGETQEWREDGELRRLIDDNFLQYASYVIRDRAIPDLDDGLKPVQRRILHSLKENDDGKFIKVANIVGHSMQYHPHGDASIADALVALANKRYLIEGQGNFGNMMTGDPAAASRYIECRLTDLAREHVFNAELTRFVPSYDGRRKEPVTLPAKLPLLLMMGAEGIAVGLSTKVLPHNFCELLEAQIAILNKKPFQVFPDFFQGGLMDVAEYDTGKGRVRLRAQIEKRDENALVIRSVPFGTTTDSLIASIEVAAKKKNMNIKTINDYTAETVEIEIVMKPGQNLDKTIQSLYAFTSCQVALSSRIVTIHDNRPVELDVDQVLRHNTKRLVKTLKRELEAERRTLLDNLHHKTLVQIFVENRIYKRIEECKTYPLVQKAVLDGVNKFREMLRRDVTQKDVEMLLAIKIKRISRYDMDKNRKEIDDILAGLEMVDKNLGGLTAYAVRYLRGLLRKYGADYPRMTEITGFEEIEVRDLTANELTLKYDKEKFYVGHAVDGEDLFQCSSLDKLMIVRGDGGYKLMNPPDKVFVDQGLQYCAVADRDKVFVAVYREEDGLTYIKRFTFGGAILNKEYSLVTKGSELIYFSSEDPSKLWIKYSKRKGQRIHQQVFDIKKLTVRGVKAKGRQLTSKAVASIDAAKPKGWSEKKSGPAGVFM